MRWWSPRQLALSDGATIAQVNDLSPNANHLLQATEANKPVFSIVGGVGRAVFDTTDRLAFSGGATLNIGSVTKLTMIAAIRHTSTAAGAICETGVPIGVNGGAGFYINNGAAGKVGAGVGTGNGTTNTAYNMRDVSGAGSVPRSYVVSATIDTTQAVADEVALIVDGIAQSTVSAAVSNTVSGNIPSPSGFSVGTRLGGTVPFNSQLFDLMVIPGDVAVGDLASLHNYLFNACGF